MGDIRSTSECEVPASGFRNSKKTRRGRKRKVQSDINEKAVSEDHTVFKCMFCNSNLVVQTGPNGESPKNYDSEILKVCKECDSLFPGTQISGKVHLRPKLNALAPYNSTKFLMEQDTCYLMDFISPKKMRTDETSTKINSSESPDSSLYANELDMDNAVNFDDSGFESFLQSQFEIDYSMAKEEHVSTLSNNELMGNILSLKSKIESVKDQLSGLKDNLHSELSNLLKDNKTLSAENVELKKKLAGSN